MTAGPPSPAQALTAARRLVVKIGSALLAAEQTRSSEALAPVIPETLVEDVVRRVLERLTGDMVRNVVLDTAERLLRQEIERLKADSEPQ